MSKSTYDDPGELQDSGAQKSTSAISESCGTSTECEITSLSESPSSPSRYIKNPGFSGLRGEAFEIKMCALLFSRATNLRCEFCIANSKDGLGAFDDIALKINKDSKSTNYFFQLKKKVRGKVTPGSLLSLQHDFSLFKLYKSYLEVESYFESNPSDPLFNGKLSNCYYILYTNAQLDRSIKPHEGDINLNNKFVMTGGNLLRLNEDQHKDIVDGIKHLPRYKEFLNKFIIMYNQANDDSLDKLIQTELTNSVYLQKYDIGLGYSIFRDFIQDWWQNYNIILNESWDSFNPLRKTKERIRLIELNEIFENRKNELKKLDLTFKRQSLSEIKNKIEMTNSILIFAPGRSTTITAAKLHQSLGDSSPHRFINLMNLDTYVPEIKATWVNEYSILFIEIPNTDTEYYNIYSEIGKIMKEEMTVVFIIQNRGNVKQLNSLRTAWNSKLMEIHDCTRISDFETLTQESFLQKIIMFQGYEISLSELINIDAIHMLEGIDTDSLSLLLANEKPIIGLELPNIPDFYIDRTLQSNLFISTEVLNEKGIVFALFGSTFSELNNVIPTGEKLYDFREWKHDSDYRFLYVDNLDDFNRLCMCESRQILWIRRERDGFSLKQSNGDRSVMKQYLEENYVTEFMSNDIIENQDRVLLITAGPGMGKSTLLTHLTKQIKIRHPNIWVVRIDINYYSKLLHRIKLDGFTDNDAIELLSTAAGINGSHCIGLASDLFHHSCLSTGNMAVLVDGIDEVTPSYFNEVVQILKVLSKTKIRKIWLTSRSFLKSDLEHALGVTSYVLKPFTREDQFKFLVKFLRNRFIKIDTSVLSRITTEYLEQLSKHLNGNEIDFLGIPLQSLLVAEIIEKKLQADGINVVIDSRSLNLLILYDLYVEKKWQIYLQEKKNSDVTNVNVILDEKDLYDIYIRNHEIAAMVSIFENEELKELQCSIAGDQWVTFLNKIEKGEEKTGIILSAGTGRPVFVHRTFGEYFAAKWFYNNFRSCKTFLRQRIFEPQYHVIKSIFDRLLAKDVPLHLAVLNNDLVGMRKILANDKNANMQDEGGRTALHLAVTYSRIDIIKLLLNHSVDFSICDNILEMSSLEYALNSSNFLALSLVMENKQETRKCIQNVIDINILKYILVICSHNGYLKLLNYIIEIKDDLLSEDCRNDLMVEAARHGQVAFISRLLAMGTRTTMRNAQGKTLLHISAESGQLKVIKFLLEYRKSGLLDDIYEGPDDICRHCQNPKWLNVQELEIFHRSTARMEYLELRDIEGNTVMHLAAKAGHIHILRYLVVELGCNVKSLNNYNQSPFVLAALSGYQDIVLFLINHGCNVTRNEFLTIFEVYSEVPEKTRKETTHMVTTTKLKFQILSSLIDFGADVEWRFDDGNTLLHRACASGNFDIIRLILELRPIMIDLKNKREETALHLAVFHGRERVVQYLLKMRASTNESDIFRNTALHLACAQGNFEIIKNLVINQASIDLKNSNMETPLYLATLSGNYDAVEYLLEKGASLTSRTRNGYSLLFGSCKAGNFRIIEFLIRNGVKIDEVDKKGNTCLHLAACTKNQPLIEFISDRIDDVNVKNYSGETALLKAVCIGNISGVKSLVKKSADVNLMDMDNCTALDIAIKNGNLELIKYLNERRALSGKDMFLLSAIKNGHTHVIEYFVKNGADLNKKNARNQTMLHIACQVVHNQSVVYLTDNGIRMDIQDQSGRTALHYAVESGNLFNVDYLIQHGANVSIADLTGCIPLHIAACRGIFNVSNYLVKHHSPIDSRNVLKQTPLFIAAMNGHEDICRILIQAGAGIFVKEVNGVFLWDLLQTKGQDNVIRIFQERAIGLLSVTSTEPTVFHRAAERGDSNYVERLLGEGIPIDAGDHLGRTALWRASLNGHSSIVELLCENGSGSTIPDVMGIKPIHAASSQKYYNVVETLLKNYIHLSDNVLARIHTDEIQVATLLLDSGCCVACKAIVRWTPLQIAADCGQASIVKILIRNQSYLDLKNDEGKTALHLAAYKSHTDCVKHLLENGASLNLQDNRGRTPLHAAIYGGKLEVMELLLHYGANANIADDEQMFPLTTAVSKGRIDMVELLLKCDTSNSPISMLFLTAVRNRFIHMIQFLQKIQGDVNEPKIQGTTLLIMSAYNGDFEIVKFLLQSGADINVQSNDGWTPLHVSLYRNHINVAKFFILEGGNINVSSKNGTTALQISVLNENIELTKFLLERNAEVNTVDENGSTALHLAAETGNEEIVDLLLKFGANMYLMNKDNWTAFHVASRYGRKEVAEILIKSGFSLDESIGLVKPLYLSVSSGQIEFTKMLLNYGFKVNEDLGSGITALYLSVAFNYFELSELLLEKGADVNGNENRTSPLHLAIKCGNISIVQLLVLNSATEKDRYTALDIALDREYMRIIQCILNIEEPFEKEVLAEEVNDIDSQLSGVDDQASARKINEEKKEVEKEKDQLSSNTNEKNNLKIVQAVQNSEIEIQNNYHDITDEKSNKKREKSDHDDANGTENEIGVNENKDCCIM